jgi:hypothetical protein
MSPPTVSVKTAISFVLTIAFCFVLRATQSRQSFPGGRTTSKSPNGRYVIRNIDYDGSTPAHRLLLEDRSKKTSIQFFSYDRGVDLLWSPNGSRLILNDHGGSDFTDAYVFLLDDSSRRIKVTEELRTKYPDSARIFSNDHLYIEGVSWIDEETIRIKVSGYGGVDPKGYEAFFIYTLDGAIRKAPK